jgi:diadenosine tetraphosphatase ApaH/serine/threonine PP2A family protein phosphatase
MTRCLVVADIHSNLVALDAVLDEVQRSGGFDELWLLGDIVGYGPDPSGCIERVRGHRCLCVAGNHDFGVTGSIDLAAFNPDAAAACLWTRSVLERPDIEFLRDLPRTVERLPFVLVHGSPREPLREYIVSAGQARDALLALDRVPHVLAGHTHVPSLFTMGSGGRVLAQPVRDNTVIGLEKGRFLLNPGAVGQPRDGDPRASYALFDDAANVVSFRRVTYDVDAVSSAMREKGLPARLGARLHLGY